MAENKSRSRIEIKPSPSNFARSQAANWVPPHEMFHERIAVEILKQEWTRHPVDIPDWGDSTSDKKCLIAELDNFEMYTSPNNRREYELQPLHNLDIKAKKCSLDGLVCLGDIRLYIHLASLKTYSILGYADGEKPSIVTYVQTEEAANDAQYDIWYMLKQPARTYRHYHETFEWIATFGKHVIDFMGAQPSVDLESFRRDFLVWLNIRFPANVELKSWLKRFGRTDFRLSINANIDFLVGQAWNLPNASSLLKHPLWAECMRGGLAIKELPIRCEKTIATPLVYECFEHMYFGGCLEATHPTPAVKSQIENRKQLLGFPKDQNKGSAPKAQESTLGPLKVGDVVGIMPTKGETQAWRTLGQDWLAYIQHIDPDQKLSVLWIYRPSDTTISDAKYPIDREVFLSDNCNCGDTELLASDVFHRYSVDWCPRDLNTDRDFLIRSKYLIQASSFVTLTKNGYSCPCRQPRTSLVDECQPGSTIYYTTTSKGREILEPGIFQKVHKSRKEVTIQRLLRLKRDFSKAARGKRPVPDNELVLTHEAITISTERVNRKCHIRFFPEDMARAKNIPFPYDRQGACDFWYLSMELAPSGDGHQLRFLNKAPNPLRQWPDSLRCSQTQKLKGLSIFSGSGNLDRGLEEGGAVQFRTSIDISANALHTQKANATEPAKVNYYCGSVDDYIKAVSEGYDMQPIARISDVQIIAAGSPCPGFSSMQLNFLSAQSLRNASHISTFCSYVDIYRPEYGFLENVIHMSAKRKGLEDENVLSQVIACLVSLGYQVSQFIMDSWNYGSIQRRSRLFIAIAAPGLEPISRPWHTHCHPENGVKNRSLGMLKNGERFGEREFYPTPFDFVTAAEGTAGLPYIGTSNIQTCIPFPDHRFSFIPSRKDRMLIQHVPKFPPGQGYADAIRLGRVPQSLIKNMKEWKKSFLRIKRDGLIPTIKTNISPQDGRGDACVHWEEHRTMTIEEARKAQGFLKDDVLIGPPVEQWKLAGNAVDRNVAMPLGFCLYQAVSKNNNDHDPGDISDDESLSSVSVYSSVEVVIPIRNKFPASQSVSRKRKHSRETEVMFTPTEIISESESEDELLQGTSYPSLQSKTSGQSTVGQTVLSRISSRDDAARMTSSSIEDSRYMKEGRGLTFSPEARPIERVRYSEPKHEQHEQLGAMRKTRHSGLQVEYTPRAWDTIPERVLKKSKGRR